MRKFIYGMAAVMVLSGVLGSSASAQGTVSLDQAKEIAMDRIHGEIVDVGFEHEDGETVYDIDMQTRYGSVEVIINAESGKVMELKKEIQDSGD